MDIIVNNIQPIIVNNIQPFIVNNIQPIIVNTEPIIVNTEPIIVNTEPIIVNLESIAPIINQIPKDIVKYTCSEDSVIMDLLFLSELKPVTSFLNDTIAVSIISDTLISKISNSCLFLDKKFFDYFDTEYIKRIQLFAKISEKDLTRYAPFLREYYLSKQLQLKIDYGALMAQCGTNSDQMMILSFIEMLHRYGSGLGGVSSYELFLRNVAACKFLGLHTNVFEGVLTYNEDNIIAIKQSVYMH